MTDEIMDKYLQVPGSHRQLFDVPENVAYFNCAYNSPQLKESTRRLHIGVDTKSRPWERKAVDFFENADRIRILAGEIFSGDREGFAIVPSSSYGASTAARIIEEHLSVGDKILVMAEEFPSNFLPWHRVAAETGATVVTVPKPTSFGWADAIISMIDERVKVVVAAPCHWTDGARVDLELISTACRCSNSILAVDATQALGATPILIDRIRPDFLFASGYKWLLCPYGFSLLYVGERWREGRPLEETWLARVGAENFAGLTNYSHSYMPGARRFDMGEKCTATILPGAIAALEQIREWGVETISRSLSQLNDQITTELLAMGFEVPDMDVRSPHMFGARLPIGYTGNLVSELANDNIFISQRGNAVRFAPHLHVTGNDVYRLVNSLRKIFRE